MDIETTSQTYTKVTHVKAVEPTEGPGYPSDARGKKEAFAGSKFFFKAYLFERESTCECM